MSGKELRELLDKINNKKAEAKKAAKKTGFAKTNAPVKTTKKRKITKRG